MTVLVTGGRGFLGSHVCRALKEHGYPVIDTDIQGSGVLLDVTNLDKVKQVFEKTRPEVVVHLAALVGGGPSNAEPHQYYYVNTLGTLNVLEACRQYEIRKFLYMSSFSPYGITYYPINELTPLNPTNPYGASKASAELIVKTYSTCYGIKAIIFRACLLAGEGQTEYNALQEFVNCALKSEPLVLFGDGEHKREWLHPSDVASAYTFGIEHLESIGESYDVFVLASGKPISMRRLAETVVDVSDSSSIIVHKNPKGTAFDQMTNTTKARDKLGWKPAVPIREIIAQVVNWRKGMRSV